MNWIGLIPAGLALVLSPLLLGILNQVKAKFAGREGAPFLQPYYTLWKLLNKGAVYSTTTSWVFRAGPILGLAAILSTLVILPIGGCPSLLAFQGDLIVFAYLLGLARFATILAALDTGSAFEGMGASREATYASVAEPALLLGLAALAHALPGGGQVPSHLANLGVSALHDASLSNLLLGLSQKQWMELGVVLALVAMAFSIVTLAENCRIPFDDQNTHLELTMIHEVMVLDHSGPDFAYITYSACLKLWVLGSLVVGILLPVRTGNLLIDLPIALVGMGLMAAAIGVVESVIARVRLVYVPQLLVAAVVLSAFALALQYGVAAP